MRRGDGAARRRGAGGARRGGGGGRALASDCADSKNGWRSDISRTTRIPLPPPPIAALMMIGSPFVSTNALTSAKSVSDSSVPGTTGTFASIAAMRAVVLSAKVRRLSTVGPTNLIPSRSHALAKSGFSERKPYPGWIASTPFSFATFTICSTSRYAATAGWLGSAFSRRNDWSAPHRCCDFASSMP